MSHSIQRQIEKYEKTGSGKYRLYLSNGEVIDTFDDIILKHNLLFKKELSPDQYQLILQENQLQEYYNACLKYISYRIRSTKEIEDYLAKKKLDQETIQKIIKKLTQEKILNDDYFCECFIKDKLRFTTMGEYRIINELKRHHISEVTIEKYRDLMNEDIMRQKIEKIITKSIRSNHKLDLQKLRNKLYHQLLNLGYPSSLIVLILNEEFNSTK